jgi:hypothetical protein
VPPVDAGRLDGTVQDAGTVNQDAGGPSSTLADASTADADSEAPASDASADAGDAIATDASPEGGPLPYPTRSDYRLKAIQPDFWPNKGEISGNNAGGIAMNLVWSSWEATKRAPPCDPTNDQEYDGHCFAIDQAADAAIADWTTRGLVVTGVAYGVPAWARTTRPCVPVAAGYEIFCAPDNGSDYGRFVGMLARRYDGQHGHGRVADFVIHNEVNSNDWFNVGCGGGTACDTSTWLDVYAASYSAAYDRVAVEQSTAKVLVSLDHHFASPDFDQPAAAHPLLSGMTVLRGLATRVAPRAFRVAYHPYTSNLLGPAFSPDDYPLVTYGNIGALAGWLRMTFPTVPSSFEIQLTESGINSLSPSTPQAQADGVCASFRNIVGTPGIENYVYHRMVDNPIETASGLGLGLHDTMNVAKPAWATWALANRADLVPPQLSCGFEDLPFVRLTRSYSGTRGHWASTRLPPAGFTTEASWKLSRAALPGAALLYECRSGQHNLLSLDVGCERLTPLGPVGWAFTAPRAGAVALFRCRVGSGTDHFVSTDPACEGQTMESLLGYVTP